MENKKLKSRLVERYLQSKSTHEELETFVHLVSKGELDETFTEYLNQQLQEDDPIEFKPSRKPYFYWAASVALACVCGLCVYLNRQNLVSFFHPVELVEIETKNREIRKVTLPDHSVVWLNENTKCSYPKQWEGDTRTIDLQKGEAYFDVAKSPSQPRFTVRMPNDQTIEVLGTEFNVNTNDQTTVFLREGSVLLRNETQQTRLSPGQVAVCEPTRMTVSRADEESYLAWMQERFVFTNETLAGIGKTLEDYYGVKIIILDNLAHRRFTGKLSKKNLPGLLDVISRTMQLQVEKHDNRIILKAGTES